MKKVFNILRYVHIILTVVTVLSFFLYLIYFKTEYKHVTAILVATTYLNFVVSLIFFIPVITFMIKFRDERENSPYLMSYVVYVVSTIASIMLMPLIQSFF